MRQLILVKHSMPEIVESVPAHRWNLSEDGKFGALKIAELLKPYTPEIIVSSFEPKALQTAEIIARQFGLQAQAVANLHEHDRSNSPHFSRDEFQKLVQEFFERPDELVFGNETANQALVRFRSSIEVVWGQAEDRPVIVVAHGTVISLFAEWLTGVNAYNLWCKLGLPSFVVLDMQSNQLLDTINLT